MQRKEPTISNLFGLLGERKNRVNVAEIATQAVGIFTEAEKSLAEAADKIKRQINDDQLEIEALQREQEAATAELDKVARIQERLKGFLE